MNGIAIGVDGGGSHTRVLVVDQGGEELASLEGEGSALRPGEVANSASVISSLVREALEHVLNKRVPGDAQAEDFDRDDRSAADSSAVEHGIVASLCVGVAGAGREGVRSELLERLRNEELAEFVTVETDAAIAMEDAFGEEAGILLIAGTGSIAFGRGPTGNFARAGGWGPTCGDEGGAYWLGRRALSVATAAADGREPETSLTGALVTVAELISVEELINWSATASPATIASLARTVMQEASNGDVRSDSLITLAAEELVAHVRSLARQLFVDERAGVTVALSGGLLHRGSIMRKRLELRLRHSVPGAHVRQEEVVPARGAVKMARRLAVASGVQ